MALTKHSVLINGIELPVYYRDNTRIKSLEMVNRGSLFSTNLTPRGILSGDITVEMLVYPWIELSKTVVVAHSKAPDGTIKLTAYPVLPKVVYSAATPKIRSEAVAIKLAKEALQDILKDEDLTFDIYTAKIEMPTT